MTTNGPFLLTLISMFPIFAVDLRIGRPMSDGNMCVGKFVPLKPHFTNCKNNQTIPTVNTQVSIYT